MRKIPLTCLCLAACLASCPVFPPASLAAETLSRAGTPWLKRYVRPGPGMLVDLAHVEGAGETLAAGDEFLDGTKYYPEDVVYWKEVAWAGDLDGNGGQDYIVIETIRKMGDLYTVYLQHEGTKYYKIEAGFEADAKYGVSKAPSGKTALCGVTGAYEPDGFLSYEEDFVDCRCYIFSEGGFSVISTPFSEKDLEKTGWVCPVTE